MRIKSIIFVQQITKTAFNMVRSILLLGLALLQATAINAVIIPEGLADGIYTIPFDSVTGEATGEPVLAARTINSRIDRRQNLPQQVQTRCGGNTNINISEFQTAKAQLEEACDKGTVYPANTAVIYTSGSTVAYFCTYNARSRCYRNEYEQAMLQVVARCGSGKTGEVVASSINRAYGGATVGFNICQ